MTANATGGVRRGAGNGGTAAARPSLPLIRREGAAPYCPALDGPDLATDGNEHARSLVLDRFKAAIGLIDQESVT